MSQSDNDIERIAREHLGIIGFAAVHRPQVTYSNNTLAAIRTALEAAWNAGRDPIEDAVDEAYEEGRRHGASEGEE